MTKNEEKAMLIYKYILFNINGYSKEQIDEMSDDELMDGFYYDILGFVHGHKTNYATYA